MRFVFDILDKQQNTKEAPVMNKGELVAALYAKTDMTKKDTETALSAEATHSGRDMKIPASCRTRLT